MCLQAVEAKVQEYMRLRCREHLEVQEKLLGRPLTFNYRYEHTRTAVGIAENLALVLGVDPDLARITAWLHDIAKCWDPFLDQAENLAREDNHGPVGGKEAAAYLRSIGCPEDLIPQIEQAIARHEGYIKDYILEDPLDALLWDADKLSKISEAGVLHYLSAQLTSGEGVLDLKEFFSCLNQDLHRGIRDSLNTEPAREWADGALAASARLHRELLAAMNGSPPEK